MVQQVSLIPITFSLVQEEVRLKELIYFLHEWATKQMLSTSFIYTPDVERGKPKTAFQFCKSALDI
jgi:hypothetical protein